MRRQKGTEKSEIGIPGWIVWLPGRAQQSRRLVQVRERGRAASVSRVRTPAVRECSEVFKHVAAWCYCVDRVLRSCPGLEHYQPYTAR